MSTNGTEPRAANVIEALARVQRDLPGIPKASESQGYKYRGIEAITAEVQGLFGRHGIVFVPRVLSRSVRDLVVNGKPWTQDELEVVYTVYGPGGVEDRIEVGPVWGLGRDNSDKGSNKSMSQALKYALLQTLCISDAKDDGDRESHATDSYALSPPPSADETFHRELVARLGTLTAEQKVDLRSWCDDLGYGNIPKRWTPDQERRIAERLDAMAEAPKPPAAPQTPAASDRASMVAELSSADPKLRITAKDTDESLAAKVAALRDRQAAGRATEDLVASLSQGQPTQETF